MILAELSVSEIPLSTTVQWFLGLAGASVAVASFTSLALNLKKLLGRNPPIEDDLKDRDKALRRMIFAAEKSLKHEFALQHADCERRLGDLEERYTELQIDRTRKWDELKNEIGEVATSVAFIRGKFEGGK